MEFKIDWKIKDFKHLPERKGQLLSSPIFAIDTLHNSQWVLHLYPYGDNDGNGKYTALYLVRKSDDDYTEDIVLNCELSFVNSSNWKFFEDQAPWKFFDAPDPRKKDSAFWKTTNHTFQKGSRCGSQEFLERGKISSYLEHGTLTVHCEVFKYDVDASTNGTCVAVSQIGIDLRSFEWVLEDFQDMQPGDKKVTPIKSASKDAHSMTMTLSMTSEKILRVDIFPVDGKRMIDGYCSLHTRKGPDSVYCSSSFVRFNELKKEENWSFPLSCSKEDLLEKQTNNSLHFQCNFQFWLGVEFEKVENTYYGPLSDRKNESCSIM